MASSRYQGKGDEEDKDILNMDQFDQEVKSTIIRTALATAYHPIEYATVLIQLGYEPFRPVEAKKFFGSRTYLALPNVFTYIKYIKSVDGLWGCYRGLLPRLISSNINSIVHKHVLQYCPNPALGELLDQQRRGAAMGDVAEQIADSEEDHGVFNALPKTYVPKNFDGFVQNLGWNVVAVSAATVASHPFHVLSVRAMAQFIGRETKFSSFWESIMEIFNTEGILGFFKGLIPRLISECTVVIFVSSAVFGVSKAWPKVHPFLTVFVSSNFIRHWSYRFQVVSTTMIANNTGLAIGKPPFAPTYISWYDCWKDLQYKGQLSRGSSMFSRSYTGRAVFENGRLTPVGAQFGPVHPIGLGIKDLRKYC